MQAITLVNNVNIPCLGLGTFKARGLEVKQAVKGALLAGYTHIDTASIYRNEVEIGEAIQESGIPRKDLFITSKASPAEHGFEKALAACASSLERLDTPYLDLYLIHWPGVAKKPITSVVNREIRGQTWRALEHLYREGKCRAIGVSNYTERHLRQMLPDCQVAPMVNQVEVHPYLLQAGLRAFCAQNGIAVAAYSPLGCGQPLPPAALSPRLATAAEGNEGEGSSQGPDATLTYTQQLLADPTVAAVAAEHTCTLAQALLCWGLQHGLVVIAKSVKPERIKENIGAFSFELGSNSVSVLDALDKGHHFCWCSEGVV